MANARVGSLCGLLLFTISAPVLADPAGDGANVFVRCSACHSVDAAKPGGMGPNLAHLLGRKAASVQGYRYSDPMRTSGIVWTRKNLDAFLEHPQAVVKGTKMPFSGIVDLKARAALISYLAAH